MHRYVSPVFLALLVASFILWYIAKLSYTYTTEQVVRVSVDGQPFEVTCVVEGVGTNLFGYRVYMNKTLRIPLSELKYKRSREEGHEGKVVIDPQSLQSAISYASAISRSSPSATFPNSIIPKETMMKIGVTAASAAAKAPYAVFLHIRALRFTIPTPRPNDSCAGCELRRAAHRTFRSRHLSATDSSTGAASQALSSAIRRPSPTSMRWCTRRRGGFRCVGRPAGGRLT